MVCLVLLFLLSLYVGIAFKSHVFASIRENNTETEPVTLGADEQLANTAKYTDWDHKKMIEEATNEAKEKCQLMFYNFAEFSQCTGLRSGMIVGTQGYEQVNDAGAAYYQVQEKKEKDTIALENGLYAKVIPDTYTDQEGTQWFIGNAKQWGAKGDGKNADEKAINACVVAIGSQINDKAKQRGLVYLPKGEYKCTNLIHVGYSNLNIIGDGKDTILFTDNDYRKNEGLSEFFFECWGVSNMYVADFRIEAREVDLYHYMRQFVLIYSSDVYVSHVDLIIPQETYHSYYFEDKQYSNFCCYSGNKNITVDGCRMEQMSGTYRGANLGVLDLWAAGEENIIIMNCDMYGNARDEQLGFFSLNNANASVKHVRFINNTVHSTEIKYPNIIGTRTMCITVGYDDSHDVEDILIAGNHFICETDSKFMTVGKPVKNLVVENNWIEIKCTNRTWSMIFDSSASDCKNVLVQKNQFYITSDKQIGRDCFVQGNVTLKDNRIFSDVVISNGLRAPETHGNNMIFLGSMGLMTDRGNFTGNTVELYRPLSMVGVIRLQLAEYGSEDKPSYVFSDNHITSYVQEHKQMTFHTLFLLNGDVGGLEIARNTIAYPNVRYTESEPYDTVKYQDSAGTYYQKDFFRERSGVYANVSVLDNVIQGAKAPQSNSWIKASGNTELPPPKTLPSPTCCQVDLVYQNNKVEEISTTEKQLKLDTILYQALETDADGNVTKKEVLRTEKEIKWYASIPGIAEVSADGTVTKKHNGTVVIYATPTDGSETYGKLVVHFQEKSAKSIVMAKEKLELQPGLKYYMDYQVLPEGTAQQLQWETSDSSVATVSQNGTVEGIKEGKAIITGRTFDGACSQSIEVTVTDVTVKQISLQSDISMQDSNQSDQELTFSYDKIGSRIQFSVKSYYPDTATNKGISKWESTDETVVTVDETGKAIVRGAGCAEVRAYSLDGACYGACKIIVSPKTITSLHVEEQNQNMIKIAWDKVPAAFGYKVYQWNKEKSKWSYINQTDQLYWKMENLETNTEYRYKVTAYFRTWKDGVERHHEGEGQELTVRTLTYQPITSIYCSGNGCTILGKTEKNIKIGYGPSDQNDEKLALTGKIEDENIVKLVSMNKTQAGTYELVLQGLQYGVTNLVLTSTDDLHRTLSVPIGVLTEETMADTVVVTGTAMKTNVSFSAIENEEEMVKSGKMTGYMVLRTQSIEYQHLEYIPAQNLASYSYEDTNIEAGYGYRYRVAPCIKKDDYYFVGNGNTPVLHKVPDEILAIRISLEQETYTLHMGDSQVITAQITPENASNQTLLWYTDNSEVLQVEVLENAENPGGNCAKITAVGLGSAELRAVTTDGTLLHFEMRVNVEPQPDLQVPNVSSVGAGMAEETTLPSDPSLIGSMLPGSQELKESENSNSAVTPDASGNSQVTASPEATGEQTRTTTSVTATNLHTTPPVTVVGGQTSALHQNASENTIAPTTTASVEQLKIGQKYTCKGYVYKYLGTQQVQVVASVKKHKKIVVPATVVLNGTAKCKVTKVGAKAFSNNKKLRQVVLGKNIRLIGSKAFANNPSLVKVVIKGKNLKKVAKNAWNHTGKQLVFYVPKTAETQYKKILPEEKIKTQ